MNFGFNKKEQNLGLNEINPDKIKSEFLAPFSEGEVKQEFDKRDGKYDIPSVFYNKELVNGLNYQIVVELVRYDKEGKIKSPTKIDFDLNNKGKNIASLIFLQKEFQDDKRKY